MDLNKKIGEIKLDKNVLAKVNGIEITQQQMDYVLKTLPPQQAAEVQTEQGRKKLLDELIAGEMFYLDAVENGLDNNQDFKTVLKNTKHSLLQSYAIQNLLKTATATDEEVKKHYEENKDQFISPEEVNSRHILVNTEEECKNIKKEIEEGLDFSEAVKKYSTCPSNQNGGSLGSFSRGKMVPEFEAAAFSLELGKVSEPVKTQFGYHLIIVDSKQESGEMKFEEVSENIKQQMISAKQYKIYNDKVASFKIKYKVEVK